MLFTFKLNHILIRTEVLDSQIYHLSLFIYFFTVLDSFPQTSYYAFISLHQCSSELGDLVLVFGNMLLKIISKKLKI